MRDIARLSQIIYILYLLTMKNSQSNSTYLYLVKDNPKFGTDSNQKKYIKTEVLATEKWVKEFTERLCSWADYNFTYGLFIQYKDWKNIPNSDYVKKIWASVFTDKVWY